MESSVFQDGHYRHNQTKNIDYYKVKLSKFLLIMIAKERKKINDLNNDVFNSEL
jgi:hypothetical protein